MKVEEREKIGGDSIFIVGSADDASKNKPEVDLAMLSIYYLIKPMEYSSSNAWECRCRDSNPGV